MLTLFKILSILPLCLAHGLGWGLGWFAFIASPLYRKRLLANARQAGMSPRRWLGAVGQSGELVAELPRLWLGRPVAVHWVGAHHIDAALARGRGVLLLTPHLGCFEVTAQAYAQRYAQEQRHSLTVLFRPPRQAWLRALVMTARQRPGLRTAATSTAGVRQMIKALRKGQAVGMLPDQVPPLGLGLWAPFFGRDAYTMTLSVRLAQQTGAAVILAWGERLSWGRGYRVHCEALGQTLPQDLAQAVSVVNRAMEDLIRRCPQQYLWGYARYKQPRQEI